MTKWNTILYREIFSYEMLPYMQINSVWLWNLLPFAWGVLTGVAGLRSWAIPRSNLALVSLEPHPPLVFGFSKPEVDECYSCQCSLSQLYFCTTPSLPLLSRPRQDNSAQWNPYPATRWRCIFVSISKLHSRLNTTLSKPPRFWQDGASFPPTIPEDDAGLKTSILNFIHARARWQTHVHFYRQILTIDRFPFALVIAMLPERPNESLH